MSDSKHQIVFSTCPDRETAGKIAAAMVEEGLAACVNIIPGLTSVYSWQGKICSDPELLLIIKTTAANYDRLESKIIELHPYDVPEIVAVNIDRGSPGYLNWISQVVKSG
ncbi:MAG: divalent-cation tolerance protein CutA [FCB group bacterium]|nr:divalent-cation tolerance protein CutA [FCB group bacterium]